MNWNWKRFVNKCKAGLHIIRTNGKASFSQAGEDQVVSYLFHTLGIPKPTFLEIGSNHPYSGNNTYFFYNRGSRGVCIEPDPDLYELLRKKRPQDIILNVGIGLQKQQQADLYIFPYPYSGWNTFSFEEASFREKESGIKIFKKTTVQLIDINSVFEKYFTTPPNFLSIDIEGLDYEILQSIDFAKYKPDVICAETISFSTKNEEVKTDEIAVFLESKGYFVYADTHINTIFCRTDIYKKPN
ncbi:MAG: FkbM family methyltransferase [Bacteroidetes bacterium]|nr:FkbM family methyltransferase [Bacteroidota bacterium]